MNTPCCSGIKEKPAEEVEENVARTESDIGYAVGGYILVGRYTVRLESIPDNNISEDWISFRVDVEFFNRSRAHELGENSRGDRYDYRGEKDGNTVFQKAMYACRRLWEEGKATEFRMYASWNEYASFNIYVPWENLDENAVPATEDLQEACDNIRRGIYKGRQK
jgi:hypothetical protein